MAARYFPEKPDTKLVEVTVKNRLMLALTLVGLLAAPAMAAENYNIAVLDGDRLVNDSLAGKAAAIELENFRNTKQKEIDTKQNALKSIKDSLEAKAASMSEEARHEQELKYQRDLSDLNILVRDAQDEYKRKETTILQPIYADLDKLIKDYVARNSIDLLLNKNNPGVIHASSRLEVTDKVLEEFNRNFKPKDK